MDELKQEKNIELIDKSIDYLENLKKNDDIQDFLEVRLVTDDTFLSQEFNVYVSINMKDYY